MGGDTMRGQSLDPLGVHMGSMWIPAGASPPDLLLPAHLRIAIVLLTQAFPPHDEVGESLKRWLLGQEAELDLDFGNTDFPVLRIQGIVLSHELKSRSSWTGTLLVERRSLGDQDFTIDPSFELAKSISERVNVPLTAADANWCCEDRRRCVTNAVDAIAMLELERTTVKKETAVTRGFCAKTWAIFTWYLTNQRAISWLLLADDDTLISVIRLLRLLGAYDSQKPVVLGQRYAYALHRPTGYAYPTGGAGIVLSRPAVEQIILGCPCPKPDTPDDMYLGMCLDSLQIPLVHVPEMHQARPEDYAAAMLSRQKPISFHKLWGESAIRAYRTYLSLLPRGIQMICHSLVHCLPSFAVLFAMGIPLEAISVKAQN
ncbi:unnamed protein product [Cyprideis torosa]|uniref:N-acetylgalactosaminide beta-1,3-galactosyltransferase n=1 Tax=Cyprideis torosa TaxID=163714 RepID=A0A7R8W8E7_9CRUS|nr:unnamed protein product [Cyprideis torosa]CAG0888484.1 unnamed protein product [Cyprideis torosa]